MFEKRRKEMEARRAEIRALLAAATDEELDELEKELDALDAEEATISRKETATNRLNRGGQTADREAAPTFSNTTVSGPINPIARSGAVGAESAGGGLPATVDSRAAYLAALQGIPSAEEAVERAERFAHEHRMNITTDALCRALTLTSGNIAQPSRVSGINPAQNEVSGIIDMVYTVDANGMGEDSVAYQTSNLNAEIKADDGNATDDTEGAPNFAIAKITPVMISTIGYVSRAIQRTTPLNYQSRVSDSALAALRKTVSRLIVTGDPAATKPEITGILKAAAITDSSDISISAIDETTLRNIALQYGGDDNVEGGGVLLLNKKDLIAFGDVRGSSEKKAVYEINFADNSTTVGTITDGGLSVQFCINNALPALTDTTTDNYVMVYGKPLAYQLDLFGPYEVEVSSDYKFAEGLLAVLGTAMVGGNVVMQNGFLRVKRGTNGSASQQAATAASRSK